MNHPIIKTAACATDDCPLCVCGTMRRHRPGACAAEAASHCPAHAADPDGAAAAALIAASGERGKR